MYILKVKSWSTIACDIKIRAEYSKIIVFILSFYENVYID